MLRFPASRRSGRPLRNASSTLERIMSCSRSRILAIRRFSSTMLSWQISAARPKPTMSGTGSVPERMPRS